MKTIPTFPNYAINEQGEVFNITVSPPRILSPYNSQGYLSLRLRRDRRSYNKLIHRLLAEVYLPNWDPRLQVNHINGIKSDNSLSNLEMCTARENRLHAMKLGLIKNSGEDNANALLNRVDVDFIRANRYILSNTELAHIFQVHPKHIAKIQRRINWKHIP